MSEIVVTHLANESGLHSEDCSSGHGIGGRTSGHELNAHRLECLPDLVSCLHVHMLHASLRESELLEKFVVREACEDVSQCVTYS